MAKGMLLSRLWRYTHHGLMGMALANVPALAWATDTTAPSVRIVVLRHGVRSPTSSPDELAPYASRPWHAWPVAPGVLTPHGAQGMQALGSRYRQWLVDDHLWSGDCRTIDQVVIIADSTPRNRDSGAALSRGVAPGCDAHYLALDANQNNPLFHYGSKEGKNDDTTPPLPSAWPPSALPELQRVLLDCRDDACVASSTGHKRLMDPAKDDAATRAKALKTAGSLSENLMLEYAQGFPATEVAWGHGDSDSIGRWISLHNLQFALAKRSMPAASQAASNLMAHILATWHQAAGEHAAVSPLASRSARTILLVGHDTNLANLGGLLDVDWHDDRQPDDYPPGGALVFDLWMEHGRPMVRVSSLMPTLDALRRADFSDDDELVQRVLPLPPCHDAATCPLASVDAWLSTRIDSQRIDTGMPSLSRWPATTH